MAIRMQRPMVRPANLSIARTSPKQTDPWYGTPAHKAWAAEVIRRAGGKCQDPEHEDTGKPYRVVADHDEERRDAPQRSLDPNNGICRCWPCHTRKTNRERARRQRGEQTKTTQQRDACGPLVSQVRDSAGEGESNP